jgi:hypothetical protein
MTFRRTRCPHCKGKLEPGQHIHPACIDAYADAEEAKAKRKAEKQARAAAKVERAETRRRKEALKSVSQLESECRAIVQEIARIRDRNDGCISCHMGPNYQGVWHGSHYRAHGGCSSLQFHLWNIHKACEQCNYFKGGNREGFIRGLLVKPGYGPDRIEWLDNQPKSKKFSREYLYRFKAVMGKRLRRMRKWK